MSLSRPDYEIFPDESKMKNWRSGFKMIFIYSYQLIKSYQIYFAIFAKISIFGLSLLSGRKNCQHGARLGKDALI
jgi:hypothetical protein